MVDKTERFELFTKEEVRDFIYKFGYWIALRKAVPGRRCFCVNETSNSADPRCNLCLGSGALFADHLMLGRRYSPSPLAGSEMRSPMGVVQSTGNMFMITADIRPNTSDYILELVMDEGNNAPLRPYQIRNVYNVIHVNEMRDILGIVSFYQIKVEENAWGRN